MGVVWIQLIYYNGIFKIMALKKKKRKYGFSHLH